LLDKTKVCLCQVLASDVRLVEESDAEGIKLTKICNRSQAQTLQARKVLSHQSLLDEITRRDVIKFIEEEDDVLERSDNDAPVTLDKESDLDSS
jgi:septum formation inhibitor-activating ATPase MinD